MRPLLVLVVVVVEKLKQEWMLLNEVMVLDLEMERIPWAMGLDQEKLVLLRGAFTQSNASAFATSIGGCVCLASVGSIAPWATQYPGLGLGDPRLDLRGMPGL